MELFFYLVLVFLGVDTSKVPPTPRVIALVEDLGDEVFDKRQKAHEELKKIGMPARRYMEKIVQIDKDLERRRRCEDLIQPMLRVTSSEKEIPNIFTLPNHIRYPFGYKIRICEETKKRLGAHYDYQIVDTPLDLGKVYYDRANKKTTSSTYSNDYVGYEATKLLTEDLIRAGMDKKKITKLLDVMIERHTTHFHPYNYSNEAPPLPMKKR